MDGSESTTNLAAFMRDKRTEGDPEKQAGPFVTLSRQYGCHGYFLGQLLVDMLNNEPAQQNTWRVYQREILDHLAAESDVAAEVLNRLRRQRPRMLVDFFRNLSGKRPGGYEIRNRIANVLRALAFEGHAILIGMGGAGATGDMENGLRIRLEAPRDWRVAKVVESEGISPVKAGLLLQKRDKDRDQLRQVYAVRFPREPSFDLVYDCSTFSLSQMTQHIIQAMKLKKMI